MALIAVKLRIRGRIQRVGYRRYVLDLAQEEDDLAGYVRNETDGSVTILVQGEKSKVSPFVKKVRNPPLPAMVKGVDEGAAEPNSRLKHFGIIPGRIVDELQEGFGAMQSEFRDYRQEFNGFANRTDESFKKMDEKYGEISAKLTNILETLQKESVETRRELTRAVDNLARLIDEYVKPR